MASLREQFENSYGNKELKKLDTQLAACAKTLRKQIARLIREENKKDAAKESPHEGFLVAAEVPHNIDYNRIPALAGFQKLHAVCAAEDVDVKLFIGLPSQQHVIGFKNDFNANTKIIIDLMTPFEKPKQQQQLKVVSKSQAPQKKPIGFTLQQQTA